MLWLCCGYNSPMNRPRLPKHWPLLLSAAMLLAAVGGWCWHAVQYSAYYVDDALISLRYAERLLDGHGLSWTAGRPVEGYSNLLWVLLVAGAGWLGLDLITATRVLGMAGMAGVLIVLTGWHFCCYVGTRQLLPQPLSPASGNQSLPQRFSYTSGSQPLRQLLSHASGRQPLTQLLSYTGGGQTPRQHFSHAIALAAGLLFWCLAVPVAAWAMLGLEQPLYCLLLAGVIGLGHKVMAATVPARRDLLWLSALLAAMSITRLDGPLFTVAVLISLCVTRLIKLSTRTGPTPATSAATAAAHPPTPATSTATAAEHTPTPATSMATAAEHIRTAVSAAQVSNRSLTWQHGLLLLILPVSCYGGQLIFRLLYYGELVPNTALVKIAPSVTHIKDGLDYLWWGFNYLAPLSWLGLLGCLLLAVVRPALGILLTVTGGLWLAYVCFIGGDIFPASRHFTPLLVVFAFSLVAGLEWVLARAVRGVTMFRPWLPANYPGSRTTPGTTGARQPPHQPARSLALTLKATPRTTGARLLLVVGVLALAFGWFAGKQFSSKSAQQTAARLAHHEQVRWQSQLLGLLLQRAFAQQPPLVTPGSSPTSVTTTAPGAGGTNPTAAIDRADSTVKCNTCPQARQALVPLAIPATSSPALVRPPPLIAIEAAGGLAYWSRLPALDMYGLNDYYLPRNRPANFGEGWIGHELGDAAYVLSRKPDLIIWHTGEPMHYSSRSSRQLRTNAEYRQFYTPVKVYGTDPRPAYPAYLRPQVRFNHRHSTNRN